MRRQGQITVFFSLILLLVISFLCTCLESGRAAGLEYRLVVASQSSLESVFAQYDKILWEEYGLLFFADRSREGSELLSLFSSYGEKNGTGSDEEGETSGVDWFSFHVQSKEAETLVLATDDNGAVFRQAVVEYMKGCGLAQTALETFLSLNVTDDSGTLNTDGQQAVEQIQKEELSLDTVQEEYERLQEEMKEAEAATSSGEEENEEEETTESSETSGSENPERTKALGLISGAMQTIKSLAQDGFLAFVVEDISSLSTESAVGEDPPSALSDSEKSRRVCSLPESSWEDTVLFNEYIIQTLDSYTSEFSYGCQIEYILAGKETDKENLAEVATMLFWVREGLNLAYLLTDAAKVAKANELATVIVGWTTVAPLVSGMAMLILTIWAMGESMADVRELLAGGKVPLMKTSADWQLGLEDLATLGRNCSLVERDKGLSYGDYLRLLLYTTDSSVTAYRTMDVIQTKIQKQESAFRMANCVYGAKVSMTISAQSLFPWLPGNVDYSLTQSSSYAYGTIENYSATSQ